MHTHLHRVKMGHPRRTAQVRAEPHDLDQYEYTVRGLVELVHDSLKYSRQPIQWIHPWLCSIQQF